MYPYLLRIGELSIPAYPIIYGLGIALAGGVILLLGARAGMNVRKLAHLVLITAISIMVGGHAFYVWRYVSGTEEKWATMLDLSQGGQVLYGGLLLAIPLGFAFGKAAKLPYGPTSDLVAVGAPLGLTLGRLACFCRGCCYGKVSDLPWAVEFPKFVDLTGQAVGSPVFLRHMEQGLVSNAAVESLPVHPAQIYSSMASLLVFFIMLWFWRTRRAEGLLLPVYLVLYAAARFALECFRENEIVFWDLTIAQVISVVIAAAIATLALTRRLKLS